MPILGRTRNGNESKAPMLTVDKCLITEVVMAWDELRPVGGDASPSANTVRLTLS